MTFVINTANSHNSANCASCMFSVEVLNFSCNRGFSITWRDLSISQIQFWNLHFLFQMTPGTSSYSTGKTSWIILYILQLVSIFKIPLCDGNVETFLCCYHNLHYGSDFFSCWMYSIIAYDVRKHHLQFQHSKPLPHTVPWSCAKRDVSEAAFALWISKKAIRVEILGIRVNFWIPMCVINGKNEQHSSRNSIATWN